MKESFSNIKVDNQHWISYRYLQARSPTVVFLPGYKSHKFSTKAQYLENFCRKNNQSYLCFDYHGCGESSGDFLNGTISRWVEDAHMVIRHLTGGPIILVGSSMGGWIMLLLAKLISPQIAGMIGIAPAPDFSIYALWDTFSRKDKILLRERGYVEKMFQDYDEPYTITAKFIRDARQHLLLKHPIEVNCPVRIFHGMQDEDVPWKISLKIVDKLICSDARLCLIKDGDHRLSTPEHLKMISAELSQMLAID